VSPAKAGLTFFRFFALEAAKVFQRKPICCAAAERFRRRIRLGSDIQTGPNGNLYIVSLSNGAIYEITRRKRASRERNRNRTVAQVRIAVDDN